MPTLVSSSSVDLQGDSTFLRQENRRQGPPAHLKAHTPAGWQRGWGSKDSAQPAFLQPRRLARRTVSLETSRQGLVSPPTLEDLVDWTPGHSPRSPLHLTLTDVAPPLPLVSWDYLLSSSPGHLLGGCRA